MSSKTLTSDEARFSDAQHARPREEFPEVDGQPSRRSQQAHSDATQSVRLSIRRPPTPCNHGVAGLCPLPTSRSFHRGPSNRRNKKKRAKKTFKKQTKTQEPHRKTKETPKKKNGEEGGGGGFTVYWGGEGREGGSVTWRGWGGRRVEGSRGGEGGFAQLSTFPSETPPPHSLFRTTLPLPDHTPSSGPHSSGTTAKFRSFSPSPALIFVLSSLWVFSWNLVVFLKAGTL